MVVRAKSPDIFFLYKYWQLIYKISALHKGAAKSYFLNGSRNFFCWWIRIIIWVSFLLSIFFSFAKYKVQPVIRGIKLKLIKWPNTLYKWYSLNSIFNAYCFLKLIPPYAYLIRRIQSFISANHFHWFLKNCISFLWSEEIIVIG